MSHTMGHNNTGDYQNGENLVKLTQFFMLFCIIVCLAKGNRGVRQNDKWGFSMVVLPCKRRNIVKLLQIFLQLLIVFLAIRFRGLWRVVLPCKQKKTLQINKDFHAVLNRFLAKRNRGFISFFSSVIRGKLVKLKQIFILFCTVSHLRGTTDKLKIIITCITNPRDRGHYLAFFSKYR